MFCMMLKVFLEEMWMVDYKLSYKIVIKLLEELFIFQFIILFKNTQLNKLLFNE